MRFAACQKMKRQSLKVTEELSVSQKHLAYRVEVASIFQICSSWSSCNSFKNQFFWKSRAIFCVFRLQERVIMYLLFRSKSAQLADEIVDTFWCNPTVLEQIPNSTSNSYFKIKCINMGMFRINRLSGTLFNYFTPHYYNTGNKYLCPKHGP